MSEQRQLENFLVLGECVVVELKQVSAYSPKTAPQAVYTTYEPVDHVTIPIEFRGLLVQQLKCQWVLHGIGHLEETEERIELYSYQKRTAILTSGAVTVGFAVSANQDAITVDRVVHESNPTSTFFMSDRRKVCRNHERPEEWGCGKCGIDCDGSRDCGCEGHASVACPYKNALHYRIAGCPDCKAIAFSGTTRFFPLARDDSPSPSPL